jgi:hypothetical protein
MLEFVTGILFLAGLVLMWRRDRRIAWLMLTLLLVSMAGGVFSVSEEGPPYVLRVSPVIIPAIFIAAIGLDALLLRTKGRQNAVIASAVVVAVVLINLYSYFGLERRSLSARRTMGAEYSCLARALAQTNLHAYVLYPSALSKPPPHPLPDERYYEVNHNFPYNIFGADIANFAVLALPGRYDAHASLSENLAFNSVSFLPAEHLSQPLDLPAAVVFGPDDAPFIASMKQHYRDHFVESQDIFDADGQNCLTVLTIR